jgi:hypothetical protein
MTIKIGKHDGSKQCFDNDVAPAIPLNVMAEELGALGIRVLSSELEHVPVIALCGAPTGRCNVFEISNEDWEAHGRILRSNGYQAWNSQPAAQDNTEDALLEKISALIDAKLQKLMGGAGVIWPLAMKLAAAANNPQGGDKGEWFPYSNKGDIGPWPFSAGFPSLDELQKLIGFSLRVTLDDAPITMEFIPTRLNLNIDSQTNRIQRIWFG